MGSGICIDSSRAAPGSRGSRDSVISLSSDVSGIATDEAHTKLHFKGQGGVQGIGVALKDLIFSIKVRESKRGCGWNKS